MEAALAEIPRQASAIATSASRTGIATASTKTSRRQPSHALSEDTDDARRLALAIDWLNITWSNNDDVSARTRALAYRSALEVLLGGEASTKKQREALSALLDDPGRQKRLRRWTEHNRKDRAAQLTDLEWSFQSLSLLRNRISHGSKILVAGLQQQRSGRLAELLLRYGRDGRLDRSFARGGVSRTPAGRPHGIPTPSESLTVLPTKRRVVGIRSGLGRPVIAFSRNGHSERSFGRSGDLLPDRLIANYYPFGPVGAIQDGKPILAWSRQITNDAGGIGSIVSLQRLTDR